MANNRPYLGAGRLFTWACAIAAPLVSATQDLTDFERATNQSLLWGPYRPNLYFGVRPRTPDGLLMGLLWSRVEDYESIQHSKCGLRLSTSTCMEQHS